MIQKGDKFWLPGDRQEETLFELHGVGYYEQMQSCIVNRPEGTGDILLMLFHDPVEVKVGHSEKIVPLKTGTLVLWPSQAGHYYGNPRAPFCHSWIHCGGTQAMRLLSVVHETKVYAPSREGCGYFLELIRNLYAEHQRLDSDPVIMLNWFHNFLLLRNRLEQKPDADAIPENFLQLQAMLARNFSHTFKLPELAAMVNYSVPHFCVKYKQYFGTTVFAHLMELRMTHANYLLHDCNLSISQIANRTGFPDVYHFSKQFKKYYHLSPTEHRNQLLHTR